MNEATFNRAIMMVLVLSVFAIAAYAEVPQVISYQGRLTDSEGNPVADGDYNVTFQIVEHDPLPLGESPLWSSGAQTVSVTNGMFVYYLGSNVPLPAEIFNDDGLDSYFLRLQVEGSLLFSSGTQLVTVPFSVRSVYSDTAAYALSGAGGGGEGGGWVDDGSVVRLQNSGDKVGIGVSTPSENLVVGSDLGSFPEANYIVSANSAFEGYSGFKLGSNTDNHATLNWYGDGTSADFHVRSMGQSFNNVLSIGRGQVGVNTNGGVGAFNVNGDGYVSGNLGLGTTVFNENLVVGRDLGSYNGNRIVVGDVAPAAYTGIVIGEDGSNRAFLTWNIGGNHFGIGIEDEGTQWNNMMKLDNGEVSLGIGSGNASVQLPPDAVNSAEILDEPGIAHTLTGWSYLSHLNWQTLGSVSVDVPAAGYVLVLVTLEGDAYFPYLDATDYAFARICIADTASGCDTESEDTWGWYWSGGNLKRRTTAIQKLCPVSDPGTHVFYVNAEAATYLDGDHPEGSAGLRASITALYIPTWYGVGGAPVAGREHDRAGHTPEGSPTNGASTASHFVTSDELERVKDENAELRRRLEALEAKISD